MPEEQAEAFKAALQETLTENATESAEEADALEWKLWAAVPSRDGRMAIVEFERPGEDTATYLFRTEGDFSAFVSVLSRALETTALKRELFSLPEEKLASEEYGVKL